MQFLIRLKHPIVVMLCFAVLIAAAVLGFSEYYFADKFFPGTVIGGEQLGGRTYRELQERVARVQASLERDGLHLVVQSAAGEKKIVVPMRSTGLTPDVVIDYFTYSDPQKVLREVFAKGHEGSLTQRLREQWNIRRHGIVADYGVVIHESLLRSFVERELRAILPSPEDARFVVSGQTVSVTSEKSGETIDVEAVIATAKQSLSKMQTNRLVVRTVPLVAAVTSARLAPVIDFASALAKSKPLKLIYDDGQVVFVGGARLVSWLSIDPTKQGVALRVNRAEALAFVRRYIDDDRAESPRNSRFMMKNGVLVETVPGTIGMAVDVDSLVQQLEAVLNAKYVARAFGGTQAGGLLGGEKVDIFFKMEFPAVTSSTIAGYGITDLLGVATTSFRGSSADRIKNIQLGAERAGGVLIAPGAEFSLVKALGEVSEETGYTKEFVIKGDRSVKEAGGGLCQIATTVFRSVLNSGLPVTERRNHSYVVGYYGPGLDATIYGPHPDMRFINDTGRFLLFQMRVEGTDLVAEFYGTRDGRMATTTVPTLADYIEPPPPRYIPDFEKPWGEIECHDQPRRGLTTQATTTVTYADGKVRTQVFDSVYQPWPKICIVGIKR